MTRFASTSLQEIDIDLESFDDLGGPVQAPKDHVRRLLTLGDVARYCGVTTDQVLGWIDSGGLLATYIPHGRYRIATGDFLAFLQRFEIPI